MMQNLFSKSALASILLAACVLCGVGCSGQSKTANGEAQPKAWVYFTERAQADSTYTVKVRSVSGVAKDQTAEAYSLHVSGQGSLGVSGKQTEALDGSKWLDLGSSEQATVTVYGSVSVSPKPFRACEVVISRSNELISTTVTVKGGAGSVSLNSDGSISLTGEADFNVTSHNYQTINIGVNARVFVEEAGKVNCRGGIVTAKNCLNVSGNSLTRLVANGCTVVEVDSNGPNVALYCGEVTARFGGRVRVVGDKTKTSVVSGGTIITEK